MHYIAKKGDTFRSIAIKFKITERALRDANKNLTGRSFLPESSMQKVKRDLGLEIREGDYINIPLGSECSKKPQVLNKKNPNGHPFTQIKMHKKPEDKKPQVLQFMGDAKTWFLDPHNAAMEGAVATAGKTRFTWRIFALDANYKNSIALGINPNVISPKFDPLIKTYGETPRGGVFYGNDSVKTTSLFEMTNSAKKYGGWAGDIIDGVEFATILKNQGPGSEARGKIVEVANGKAWLAGAIGVAGKVCPKVVKNKKGIFVCIGASAFLADKAGTEEGKFINDALTRIEKNTPEYVPDNVSADDWTTPKKPPKPPVEDSGYD